MSFFLAAEQVWPLNYGATPINEQWTYLGTLYQVSESIQFGMMAALQWQTWGSTSQFNSQNGFSYVSSENSNLIGLLAVIRL